MKKTISLGAALVAVSVAFIYVPRASVVPQTISVLTPSTASTTPTLTTSTPPARTVTKMVIATSATNATLVVGKKIYPITVSPGETVVGAMHALASTSDFTFTSRDYPGLGEFVDSINGVQNAGGKYWMLYVNGISATSGASLVTLATDDKVEWKYEKGY